MLQSSSAAHEQQETSYGAAFFDFPPAPHCANPEQVADELWRSLFIKHARSAAHTGLFRSCRTGRDWVLREAPKAILLLDTAAAEPREQWLARLAAVQQALVTRGAALTAVALVCGADAAPVRDILQHLQTASAGIPILHLTFTATCGALAELIGDAGSALPNLSILNLTACPLALPLPEKLPSVKHLHLKVAEWGEFDPQDEQRFYTRLGRYLRQLTSLTITRKQAADEDSDHVAILYACMFGNATLVTNAGRIPMPGNTTHTLTRLTLNTALDYNLLRMLVKYTPQLTHLCGSDLEYLGTHMADEQWAVIELKTTGDNELLVHYLAGLPKNTAGSRLDVIVQARQGQSDALIPVIDEGFNARVRHRLCEWRLHARRLVVLPMPDLPTATSPSAISAALRHLAALEAPGVLIDVNGWPGTPEVLQAIATPLPLLSHMDIVLNIPEHVTDATLAHMLRLGSIQVDVDGLALTTTQHGDKCWPWQQLSIDDPVCVYDIVKLPVPEPGKRAVMCCNKVLLYAAGDPEVPSVESVRERLLHIEWHIYRDKLHIELSAPFTDPPHPHTTDLPTQLGLLTAMQLTIKDVEADISIDMRGWAMPHDNMAALSSLPAWGARLDLTQCGFPLEPTEYRRLAEHVPTTYTSWVLPGLPDSPQVHSVCAGLNERRQGLGLSRVYVVCPEYEGEEREVGEHVMVTGKRE